MRFHPEPDSHRLPRLRQLSPPILVLLAFIFVSFVLHYSAPELSPGNFCLSLHTHDHSSRRSIEMATTKTAVVTGTDVPRDGPTKRRSSSAHSHANRNGFSAPQPLARIRTHMKKKYRHVAAVHSKDRASCLSHDSESAPSFLGFRNLMVIVLSVYVLTLWSLHLTPGFSRWKSAIDDREF
jgi:hypothetical protein